MNTLPVSRLACSPAAVLALCCAALVLFAGDAVAQAAVAADDPFVRMYGEDYAPIARAFADTLRQLAIVMLVALPFQLLFPAVKRRAKMLSYEYWLDIVYWFQGLWLILLSFFVAFEWLAQTLYGGWGPLFPALRDLPLWVQVLIAVWAFDFLVYWRHRWEHTFSALWSFHAVHHTAERVDILTTVRLHPFELALGLLFNASLSVVGLHPAASAPAFAIYLYYNYFIHTNVRIKFPGFLKYVFVSPFMHQWHHAKDQPAMGKNVGVVFAWNDWLFRTAYHPDHWPTEFGFSAPAAERVPQSYVRQILYPVQFALARMGLWRVPATTVRGNRPLGS